MSKRFSQANLTSKPQNVNTIEYSQEVRHSTDSHEIEVLKLEMTKKSDVSKNTFEKNIG